ncbi:ArnT family glycosyltransferase [Solirhodobacter olei]|uniref:ArnT family glycosyltransferase n=1 Tax=Solirhodobacter olei TaxID=2493082 RepID=UPI000FD7D4B4|nr:glycosyltransferase family 39 protein [Solirhodobacter olei]
MERLAAGIERWVPRLPRAVMAALLVVLALGAALPAFTGLPPVDRDEPRFAQASKQMAETGNLVDIRFQSGTRYKKPIGIYWLQAATVAAIGKAGDRVIWHYRLPSLLAVLLSVLLSARIGSIFGGFAAGRTAGLMMAGAFLLLAEAHLATTDASLLAAILAAQTVLAGLYARSRAVGFARDETALPTPALVLFWGALAASVLLKGPVGPMVVGLTVAALALLHRRAGWLRALRPLPGFLGFLIVTVPWFVAITLRSGGAFWTAALDHDLLGKVISAQESHGAPPGSYLAMLWLTFFPASVPLALSLPAIWRGRASAGTIFAAAWVIPAWIVFEASPTKLMHYVLPLYPGLALAAALAWPRVMEAGLRRWQKIVTVVLMAIPVIVLLAAAGYGVSLGHLPFLPALLGLAALALGAALAWPALRAGMGTAALIGLWLMGAGFAGGLLSAAAAIPGLWPSPAIVALAAPSPACPARPIVTDGYDEPSLVFLAPSTEEATTPEGVAQAMAKDPCTLGVVADPGAFLSAAKGLGLTPVVKGQVKGLNLGSGHRVSLTAYAAR